MYINICIFKNCSQFQGPVMCCPSLILSPFLISSPKLEGTLSPLPPPLCRQFLAVLFGTWQAAAQALTAVSCPTSACCIPFHFSSWGG